MDLVLAGMLVALAGIAIIVAAALLLRDKGDGQTKVKGGGVVMIGPIPIIFGSDARWTAIAIILAIILMALWLVLFSRV